MLIEIEAPVHGEPHIDERAATLTEFVVDLGGTCSVAGDGRSACLIAIELPMALVADE